MDLSYYDFPTVTLCLLFIAVIGVLLLLRYLFFGDLPIVSADMLKTVPQQIDYTAC
jgi:hypothetical protein